MVLKQDADRVYVYLARNKMHLQLRFPSLTTIFLAMLWLTAYSLRKMPLQINTVIKISKHVLWWRPALKSLPLREPRYTLVVLPSRELSVKALPSYLLQPVFNHLGCVTSPVCAYSGLGIMLKKPWIYTNKFHHFGFKFCIC